MIRRLDIGWRNESGDHGVLAALDGPLRSAEAKALLPLTDPPRDARFGEPYWVVVSLPDEVLGVARVTPVAGGMRGQAATAQAILVKLSARAWGTPFDDLPASLPAPPARVAESAKWHEYAAPQRRPADDPSLRRRSAAVSASTMQVLMRLIAARNSLVHDVRVPVAAGLAATDQVLVVLEAVVRLPLSWHERGFSIVTSRAPALSRACFRLAATAGMLNEDSTEGEFARLWLRCIERFAEDPELLACATLDSPKALMTWLCAALHRRHSRCAATTIDAIWSELYAAGHGLRRLERQRERAFEDFLLEVSASAGGGAEACDLRWAMASRIETGDSNDELRGWATRLLIDPEVLQRMADGAPLLPIERDALWQRAFARAPKEMAQQFEHLHSGERVRAFLAIATSYATTPAPTADQLQLLRRLAAHLSSSLGRDDLLYARFGVHYLEAGSRIGVAAAINGRVDLSAPSSAAEALQLYYNAERVLSFEARRPAAAGRPPAHEQRMLGGREWHAGLTRHLRRSAPRALMSQLAWIARTQGPARAMVVLEALGVALPTGQRLFLPLLRKALTGVTAGSDQDVRA